MEASKPWIILGFVVGVAYAVALEPQETDLYVRVVDVGAGHCSVVKMPGNFYMVYDAGNYTDSGRTCFDAVSDIVPEDVAIELMVLSHSDSDHLGGVDEILDAYTVKRIIRSGYYRDTKTWKVSFQAVMYERYDEGLGEDQRFVDINLKEVEFPRGATYQFGDTFVTMVTGYHEPPSHWDIQGESERRNAGSIVIRVQYKGRSILFTGDTVGRHIDDPPDSCLAAEKEMVEMSPVIPIRSEVIIAPHHGADNGSSTEFIKAVDPKFVIFPAGHKHDHPTKAAAERYLAHGVELAKMFRTDRGDDEGSKEWDHERVNGHSDPAGDDDVDIIITQDGDVQVAYRDSD